MPVPVSSLQSVNPSPIIELFELTLNSILFGTEIHITGCL